MDNERELVAESLKSSLKSNVFSIYNIDGRIYIVNFTTPFVELQ